MVNGQWKKRIQEAIEAKQKDGDDDSKAQKVGEWLKKMREGNEAKQKDGDDDSKDSSKDKDSSSSSKDKDDKDKASPKPTTTTMQPKKYCDAAVGILSGTEWCCPRSCLRGGSKKCGGSGCKKNRGGAAKCCTGGIKASGKICQNEKDTACKVPTPQPTTLKASPKPATTTTQPKKYCDAAVGILVGTEWCCPRSCLVGGSKKCGGSGCSKNRGGVAKCCTGAIKASGKICQNEKDTACKVPTPQPTTLKDE